MALVALHLLWPWVRKYAEQLADLDPDIIGVVVTHMDTVTWSRQQFSEALSGELGISGAVFSGASTTRAELHSTVLGLCRQRYRLSIDGENFFKLFKIHNNNLKIVRSCKKQVELFRAIKKRFYEIRSSFPPSLQADLAFEFQAYMNERIEEAKKVMAAENNFSFMGDTAANEAGHVANMANQLRAILHDIRIETLNFAAVDHGVNDLRRCPHCGLVWAKVGRF